MTTPDGRPVEFFVIGPPKCGTTTIHEVLRRHPDIFLPATKDKSFLVDTIPNYVTEKELPAYYTEYKGEVLVGCSEASLIGFPSALRRVQRYNPGARLIAILRNPVDRAYSAYWFARRNLIEDSADFESALANECKREQHGDYRALANLRYCAQGRYAEQLETVFELFPRERVFVGLFEDLRSNPAEFVQELIAWLGADPTKLDAEKMRVHSNAAVMPRSRLVQHLFVRPPAWLRNAYHAVLPARAKVTLWTRVIEPILARNRAPFRYPPMAEETRAELAAYFAPYNARLAALLGRDLAVWQ